MSNISELAVIDPAAKIGKNVTVGPFCVIGPDVEIGEGTEIMNSVTLDGNTRIGKNNVIYPYAVVGVRPLDLKYKGEPTLTLIGDNNVIREHCTVHRGTELGGGKTVIGDNNLFMTGSHVAHDCIIQNNILIGNQVLFAGHVKVEDYAVISASVGIHHFVTVGKYSYIAGMTAIRRDVSPFMKIAGDPEAVRAVNSEGLSRNGFDASEILALKEAYKKLFRSNGDGKNLIDQINELQSQSSLTEHVKYLCEFTRNSCESRFHRSQENNRHDTQADRQNRSPVEIQQKVKG